MPTISQCPVVVSLPGEARVHRPYAPVGAAAAGMPVNGLILPRPSATMFGKCKPRSRAMLPRVLAPGGSPKDAASGMAPMPTLSRTIQMTRRNTIFERNTQPPGPYLRRSLTRYTNDSRGYENLTCRRGHRQGPGHIGWDPRV